VVVIDGVLLSVFDGVGLSLIDGAVEDETEQVALSLDDGVEVTLSDEVEPVIDAEELSLTEGEMDPDALSLGVSELVELILAVCEVEDVSLTVGAAVSLLLEESVALMLPERELLTVAVPDRVSEYDEETDDVGVPVPLTVLLGVAEGGANRRPSVDNISLSDDAPPEPCQPRTPQSAGRSQKTNTSVSAQRILRVKKDARG
jgi:hypothetical protein